MQIPILAGVYTDEAADFRLGYPVNLVPVVQANGISKGYLRPADGAVRLSDGPGTSRGGINWNGVCYRVMGSQLVSVSENGSITAIGDVGGSGRCAFDYSFDRLAITSGGALYYYDGVTLTKVTDTDLGQALDVVFIDGYFMTTDGKYLVTSDISNPMSFSPLKYGASEIDPDPINSINKLRNEIFAVNRYTIEVFRNVGGSGFPFDRITGAQIQRGSVGTWASVVFMETVAFVGGGHSESPGVFMAVKAQCQKISSREIDEILSGYAESVLAGCVLEVRNSKGQNHLWVRLKDRTLVYDYDASAAGGEPVWFVLTSGLNGFSEYTIGDLVWCYNRWQVANPTGLALGYLTDKTSSLWGDGCRWEFMTSILYGEGKGAIFHSLELVCLTGRVALGKSPTIRTSYSVDGMAWSQERSIGVGSIGDRTRRLIWYRQGIMRHWRVQRFRGDSDAFLSIARLEAALEPLGA